MKFYGQFDTDKIIFERYFPNPNYIGNCIEVGAVDGIELSNTLFFEQRGWECLCIEPQPGFQFFDSLAKNRKIAVNCAISSEEKDDAEFTIIYLKFPNTSGFIQCSGISGLHVDINLLQRYIDFGCEVKKQTISVQTKPLKWCIENHFNKNPIDFISIDVEGSELDVLKSFDINAYNTKLMIIENNDNDSNVENYMKERGWRKDLRIEVNDFYVKV